MTITATKLKKATFKHIEAELLNLGNEILKVSQEILEWETHPENLRYSLISYVRRSRWLREVIDAIDILYNKVDNDTKDIIDLMYFKNFSRERVMKEKNISARQLQKFHRLIVNAVMEKLGFLEVTDQIELSRYLPAEIKREVLERDGHACVKCGGKQNLHFHHIFHYSEGGTHEPYNLVILCASCHAEEHKRERPYHLLKAMAEE